MFISGGIFMFITRFAISSISAFLSFISINADTTQTIDILNNSNQQLQISANNTDHSLKINHTVPAYAKSLIIVKVTYLKSLQDTLFEAILNDSPEEIKAAIQAGANVNIEKEGKRPLMWAVAFHRTKAAQCLLEHGAI
jgi:hypothetical protein